MAKRAQRKSKSTAPKKARTQRRTTRKKTTSKTPSLPKLIFAQVSPHSVGGVSMFDAGDQINSENVANFTSEPDILNRACNRLGDAGFQILQVSESTINICGPAKAYEQAFGSPIVVEQRKVIKEGAREDLAEFMECHNHEMPGLISPKGSRMEDLIEGVALEEPRYYMSQNPFPPSVDYWHLDVPADVSLGCNADRAHRGGTTGKGVKVAMADSGWYAHPFFASRGYRTSPVTLGPGAANPTADENGHGTGESANIFACAPDVQLLPVKMNFANSTGAFNSAVGLGPDIITCSWGSDIENGPLSAANQVLASAISSAVAAGITVVFSAGNGHWGYPGQHPDVISAGGVFMDPDLDMRASDYSSGFASKIYANRDVPDVCGLVGMRPGAKYIMLPLEPGCAIDTGGAGGNHPNGDETANNDGWATFSGTSAAAPQLAGVAALIKQACSRLTPAQIRQIMITTARDVRQGRNHPRFNHAAVAGHDLATGHGLVDAHRAVLIAKLRCRRVIKPVRPIRPTPVEPVRPIQPIRPIRPIRPVLAASGDDADPAAEQSHSSGDLSDDDLQGLEEMVMAGELDSEDIA